MQDVPPDIPPPVTAADTAPPVAAPDPPSRGLSPWMRAVVAGLIALAIAVVLVTTTCLLSMN